MFQNRIAGFVGPTIGTQHVALVAVPTGAGEGQSFPFAVQISDIYQAARKRAEEQHELDKLFNPDFYDYQI